MTVKVNVGALVALAQYYDVPLICFTFKDFQLTSAIEEFERILGRYLKYHSPSTSLGETHTPEMIALTLNLTVREVTPNMETIGDLQGFSRKFLETKAITLEGAWSWKAFSSALALLIYVIVLFPNADDFLDFPAINVCLAKNLVLAFLVDVYYYLHTRHDKKGGSSLMLFSITI